MHVIEVSLADAGRTRIHATCPKQGVKLASWLEAKGYAPVRYPVEERLELSTQEVIRGTRIISAYAREMDAPRVH